MRLPKQFKHVDDSVARVANKHGVRIHQFANVGNHLHLLLKIPSRPRWAAIIREFERSGSGEQCK